MQDSFFLDSNILLYLLEDNISKKEKTVELIFSKPIISTQVINENINVCIKKFKMNQPDIRKHLTFIMSYCSITFISNELIDRALKLSFIYYYSYYDSLILASSLEMGCNILYTEDFQKNQLI